MINTLKIMLFLAFSLIFSGCANNYKKISKTEIFANDYYSILAMGYKNISFDRAENYNWRDAEIFAKKATHSVSHHMILPEDPKNWMCDECINVREAYLIRHVIIDKITENNIRHRPEDLALLVLSYDYWLFALCTNKNIDEVILAKNELLFNLDTFAKPIIAGDIVNNSFKLKFNYGQKKLNNNQVSDLKKIYKTVNSPYIIANNIIIRSYYPYENKISNMRLFSLISELKKLGVEEDKIQFIKYFKDVKNHFVDVDFISN